MARKESNKPQDRVNGGSQQNSSGPAPQGSNRGNGNGQNEVQGEPSFSAEEISARAYQIFERDGRSDGRDMDHWLQAEQELRAERESSGNRIVNASSRAEVSTRPEEAPRSARRHQQATSV